MSAVHRGNLLNEITFEQHDPVNNAVRVNLVAGSVTANSTIFIGTPTLFAVVNTAASGQASVALDNSVARIGFATVNVANAQANTGNVTLNPSPNFIGLVTIANAVGNATLNPSPNFIGLATVNIGSSNATLFAVVNTAAAGQASVVLDNSVAGIGFATVFQASSARTITGNLTLSDSKTFIGLTTTTLGASPAFIGIATVIQASSARTITGNLTLSDSKGFIGLVTLGGGSVVATGNVASEDPDSGNPVKIGAKYNSTMPTYTDGDRTDLQAGARGELKVNIYNGSQVVDFSADNADGASVSSVSSKLKVVARNTVFNGSTWDRMAGNATGSFMFNVGTTKTLIPKNVSFAQASIATVAVPTGTFNMTSLILNSNATVGMRVKSGATYLIGNVSLSVMLNPGGGWVQHGSVDSPVYKGLAGAAAIVLEKEDLGQVAEIAGHLMYFDE